MRNFSLIIGIVFLLFAQYSCKTTSGDLLKRKASVNNYYNFSYPEGDSDTVIINSDTIIINHVENDSIYQTIISNFIDYIKNSESKNTKLIENLIRIVNNSASDSCGKDTVIVNLTCQNHLGHDSFKHGGDKLIINDFNDFDVHNKKLILTFILLFIPVFFLFGILWFLLGMINNAPIGMVEWIEKLSEELTKFISRVNKIIDEPKKYKKSRQFDSLRREFLWVINLVKRNCENKNLLISISKFSNPLIIEDIKKFEQNINDSFCLIDKEKNRILARNRRKIYLLIISVIAWTLCIGACLIFFY